ncbi:hypothetical protein GCM10009780_21990 [Actinomadura alba]
MAVLGVITATPALAVGWQGALEFGYGLGDEPDPMVLALLQHRGVLQGALGSALIWAAYRPAVRVPVAVTAIITKSSFIALMFSLPDSSWRDAASGVLFDVVTIALLAFIAVRQVRAGRTVVAAGESGRHRPHAHRD